MDRRTFLKLSGAAVAAVAAPLAAAKALEETGKVLLFAPRASGKTQPWLVRSWALTARRETQVHHLIGGGFHEAPGVVHTRLEWEQETPPGAVGLPQLDDRLTLQDFARNGMRFPIPEESLPRTKFWVTDVEMFARGDGFRMARYNAVEVADAA